MRPKTLCMLFRALFPSLEEVGPYSPKSKKLFSTYFAFSLFFSVALAPLPFKPNSGALDSWARYIGWYLVKYQQEGGGGGIGFDLKHQICIQLKYNVAYSPYHCKPNMSSSLWVLFHIVASVTLSICIRLQISDKCLGAIPEWFRWGNRKVIGVLNVFRPHANIN